MKHSPSSSSALSPEDRQRPSTIRSAWWGAWSTTRRWVVFDGDGAACSGSKSRVLDGDTVADGGSLSSAKASPKEATRSMVMK